MPGLLLAPSMYDPRWVRRLDLELLVHGEGEPPPTYKLELSEAMAAISDRGEKCEMRGSSMELTPGGELTLDVRQTDLTLTTNV